MGGSMIKLMRNSRFPLPGGIAAFGLWRRGCCTRIAPILGTEGVPHYHGG